MKWIQVRGPSVSAEDANGLEHSISAIWYLIHDRDQKREDFEKFKVEMQHQTIRLEKVTQLQIDKYGADHPKMSELHSWAAGKKEQNSQKAKDMEASIQQSEESISVEIKVLLRHLCSAPPDMDPECTALLNEVEGLFGDMSMEDSGKPAVPAAGEDVIMDVTSIALAAAGLQQQVGGYALRPYEQSCFPQLCKYWALLFRCKRMLTLPL